MLPPVTRRGDSVDVTPELSDQSELSKPANTVMLADLFTKKVPEIHRRGDDEDEFS